MDKVRLCKAVPRAFLNNLKKLGYTELLPIQQKVLEIWFNGAAPEKADDIRRAVCGTMANNVFIASATGSGKTLSVILPLALEAFAGLDFVALFVVPTTHLLAQTHRLLLRLFHDVPSVQVLQAMDCLGATLYEDPALLRLDPGVVAELREHRASQVVGTDASTPVDDHLVKRLLGSLMERRTTRAPDLRRIIDYGADRTSYIICGTPGIVSALLAAIEPAPSADPGPRATAPSSKLRHVVIDEADHVLLNDNTAFLMLAREFFAKRSSTAVFRVPRFFAERHQLGLPTDRFVFLSATMKYRASLLENMGLHGGLMVDFDGQEGARLALSPNVEHFVIQFKQPYSEIDIAYLVFRFLCSPGGAIANPRTTLLPCIIFVNSRHTMQRVAHLLFLIMVKIYRELRYRIVLVAQGHVFRRPSFESVPAISNESLEECPADSLATDSFARGLNSGIAISLQRDGVEYKFDTLINFNLSQVIS